MAGPVVPIQYRVDSKEDVIIAYALREYFAAISSLGETINYFDKRGKYPLSGIRSFKSHTIHLLLQLSAFSVKFNKAAMKLIPLDGFASLKEGTKIFFQAQAFMKGRGMISLKGKSKLRGGEKGKLMALGIE